MFTSTATRLRSRAVVIALSFAVAAMGAVATVGPASPAFADEIGYEEGVTPTLNPNDPDPQYLGPEDSMPPIDEVIPGDNITPAYYLYTISDGTSNLCANTMGAYNGVYLVPIYNYDTVVGKVAYYQTAYKTTQTVGTQKTTTYEVRGFTTASRYSGCANNHFARRYYGEHKVSRTKKLIQNCYSGGCTPPSTSYGAWKNGWA